jgi:hypothetical protein
MRHRLLYQIRKIWPPLFVALSLYFIGNFFYHQSSRLSTTIHLSLPYTALTLFFQVSSWFVAVRCWQKLVYSSTRQPLGFLQGFNHLTLVSLGKYFPGKVWGMVARISMMKNQGIAYHQSAQATIHEQFLTLHASGILSILLAYVLYPSPVTLALLIAAGASILLILPLQRIGVGLIARFSRKPLIQNEETHVINFWQTLKLLLGFCLIWVLVGSMLCGIYFALFPATPSWQIVAHLILANTIGITLGFLALFSPGGLGVREAVTSSLLATQMPFTDALLLTLVFRLWLVISEMLTGGILLLSHKTRFNGNTP